MAKQPKIHTVYTLQVKANGTQQFNQATLDDMLESIGDTVKNWFPKGEVELTKHDVVNGDKRVVITNVFATRNRKKSVEVEKLEEEKVSE